MTNTPNVVYCNVETKRLVLKKGDEATFTVTLVNESWIGSYRNVYRRSDISSVRLLHREEADHE